MQGYNLSFLEACELYDEGECEAIESESICRYKAEAKHGAPLRIVNFDGSLGDGINLTALSFLGKWRIIPKPVIKHKEVFENVKWQKGDISGIISPEGCNWGKLLNRPRMKVTCEWPE